VDGDGLDGYASYHDAELVPPHGYLAFYFWLRHVFGIDAIVHVGKHGNLEWLPGKSVALSDACWPDAILGPLPHLYPFIVNDPGEGAQAKRRTQAVIIDHLMPPLTRAENYGPLQDLERQVDEYYEALTVDARRAQLLRKEILATIVGQQLHTELGLAAPAGGEEEDALLNRTDAWLCELKESQIRDGLHVFGQSPAGVQRRWAPTSRWATTSTRSTLTGPRRGWGHARRCWRTSTPARGATMATRASGWKCWHCACLTGGWTTRHPCRTPRRFSPGCARKWRHGWTPAAHRN
jgi:cobalamin biosynthesis Mg chelatase CobN